MGDVAAKGIRYVYAAINGSSSNDGLSPSNPWDIETLLTRVNDHLNYGGPNNYEVVGVIKAGTYDLVPIAGISIPVLPFGGGTDSWKYNRQAKFIGYYQSFDEANEVSDLDCGQPYHESPLESLRAATVGVNYPKFDGHETAFSTGMISTDSRSSIVFKNIYFTCNGATGSMIYNGGSGGDVLRLSGCKFVDDILSISGYHTNVSINDCFFDQNGGRAIDLLAADSYVTVSKSVICDVADSIIKMAGSGIISGNLFIGAGSIIQPAPGAESIEFVCNTCYGQTDGCLKLRNDVRYIIAGNIVSLADDNYGFLYGISGWLGTVVHNDHNCIHNATVFADLEESSVVEPQIGQHSIEVDPKFADISNDDYRPTNKDVLRAKYDVAGNKVPLGAVLQGYQAVSRARGTNMARLGITK